MTNMSGVLIMCLNSMPSLFVLLHLEKEKAIDNLLSFAKFEINYSAALGKTVFVAYLSHVNLACPRKNARRQSSIVVCE